jgi:four helix bundle protein
VLNQKSKLKDQNFNSKLKPEFRERCYNFSISIIKTTRAWPNERIFWNLTDQLLRSATSIGANIVEAKSASSKRDYIKYYEIALQSANETKYWLGLLRDALDVNKTEINKLLNECIEISNILAASLITMKEKK